MVRERLDMDARHERERWRAPTATHMGRLDLVPVTALVEVEALRGADQPFAGARPRWP